MTTMILSHSHMTSIYLPMSTMTLSHSHITLQFTFIWQLWYCHIHIWQLWYCHIHIWLQFTFIWQLWYCHIHIWLFNLPSYDNYDIVTFTYDSNLPSYNNYDIVAFTYDSSIYLHMTTMILSHSHMTLQFTFI